MQSRYSIKSGAGFTLVELMVSMSIFVVIMLLVMGAVLSILNINSKAQSAKTAMDNLDFALESVSRTVRFGTNFHCGLSGTLTAPQNCSSGDTSLTVTASDGSLVTYTVTGGALTRSVNSGTALALTSPEVTISNIKFYVFGAPAYGVDYLQPRVTIAVAGLAGSANKTITQTSFQLETTVSQRKLDI